MEIKLFLINFINVLGKLIFYAVFVRVILSWVQVAGGKRPGRFAKFIQEVTDPVIGLARKLPHTIGMMDLSPFIALIGVDILTYLLVEFVKYLPI
ncbi:YggT family protein [Candidatus Peregrinibacteria bacterium]|jgi:uncharacterized protein YggT (Ycf19 family)|nr:YggT family protein [Candidatus Peregrinibacteria bacterium]